MNLKRLLRLRQSDLLGLDIGSSSIKIVRLKKQSEGYSVSAAGLARIEDCDDEADQLVGAKARATQDCLRSLDVNTNSAVCGVCGPEAAVRDFRFPPLGAEELASAVSLEAKQVCPFNTEDATVDYHVTSGGGDQTRGVLVAATRSLIEQKRAVARLASLECVLMDVDGLALLNCYEAWERDTDAGATAILNVGGCWTTLAIRSEAGLPFIRDITFGGDSIIRRIAEDNDTEAEVVRRRLAGERSIADLDISEALKEAAEKLIADVSRTLRYYATGEQSAPVSRILVCGGFAGAAGFVELLSKRLGMESLCWNPLEAMAFEGNDYSREVIARHGPALAVAAGLAMRSI